MTFVDREQELAFLKRHFASRKAELLVIWGRRRVGKTMLLQRFGESRAVLHHIAVRTTPTDELRPVALFDDLPFSRVDLREGGVAPEVELGRAVEAGDAPRSDPAITTLGLFHGNEARASPIR